VGAIGVAAAGLAGVWLAKPFAKPPETIVVTRHDLAETVEVSGVAESSRHVVLKAKATGLVKALVVAENRRAVAGAELLRLDGEQARLGLAQAVANAEAQGRQAATQRATARRALAEATARQAATLAQLEGRLTKAREAAAFLARDLARFRELGAEGAVSRQAVDQQAQQARQARLDERAAADELARVRTGAEVVQARNALAIAETALANAEAQGREAVALARQAVADTVVRAPFAGFLTDWVVEVGDMVAPGTPLGTFQDLDTLRVRLPVDELDLPKMRTGGPVELLFDAFPDRPLAGTIAAVSRASVEGTGNVRVYPVEVRFANADGRIAPGMSCDATVLVRKLPRVLAVPVGAVAQADGRPTVQVLRPGGAVETVAITSGLTTLDEVEVKAGLAEGDRVVTRPGKPK
jgi:multidrug efflux pump subunit AcrA (membrane-fusion protein)